MYADADVQIFDDPLSALDAHVGQSVFSNVLLDAPKDKTRVLVTHAVHVLPEVDYIYIITDGIIRKHGSYSELMAANGDLSTLVRRFGKQEAEERQSVNHISSDLEASPPVIKTQEMNTSLTMTPTEERNVGAVGGDVYTAYARAGNGKRFLPLLLAALFLVQALSVTSSYWLVWWQADCFHWEQRFYVCLPFPSPIVI